MAYQLTQQIQVLNKHSSIDLLYGPYSSKEQACAAIPEAIRDYGKTLLIGNDIDGYIEYWWKDELTDEGLIIKIIQSDWNETNETSPAYIKNKPEISNKFTIQEKSIMLSTGGLDFEYNVIDGVNEGDIIVWKNTKATYKINPDIRDDGKGISDCDLLLDHLYQIRAIIRDNVSYQYIIHLTGPIQSDYDQTDENSPDFIKNKPNGVLTLKAGDNTKTVSINQKSNVDFEIPISQKDILGLIKTSSTITDSADLTPCPIVEGIPYYKDIKIIDDTFFKEITNDNYKVYSLNLSNNTFFIYNGTSIKYINNSEVTDDIQICIPNIIYLFNDNTITRLTDLHGFKTNSSAYTPKIIDCAYKYNYITGSSILDAIQNLANFKALKPGDTIFIIFEYRTASGADELNFENITAKNNIVYKNDNPDNGIYEINDQTISIYNISNINQLYFTGSASYYDKITFKLTLNDRNTLYFDIDDYQNKDLIRAIDAKNESTNIDLITTSTKITYVGQGVGHILYITDVQFANSQILLYNNTSQTDKADINFTINADNNIKVIVEYGKYELLHITYIDNKLFIRHKNNEYQTNLWNQ